MKYIKLFNNDAEYQAFRGGGEYITPNLCLNSETWETKCEPKEEVVSNEITFIVGINTSWPEPGEIEADEKIYTAVEGMSFGEFINSKYNIDNWYVNKHEQIITHHNSVLRYEGRSVYSSDIILNNVHYIWGLPI